MIFHIKEKFWSFGNSFTITDQDEQPRYTVKGKAFSWGDHLTVYDRHGEEAARIHQKMMSFKPRYHIYIGDALFAEMIKEHTWFKKKFTLDLPGPNDITVEGSFSDREFIFRRGNDEVAHVSKDLWRVSGSYGVRIDREEDELPILCACLVIDQIITNELVVVAG
jgi:uncharacterized protein YxjI